jgi:hypothetical protein
LFNGNNDLRSGFGDESARMFQEGKEIRQCLRWPGAPPPPLG